MHDGAAFLAFGRYHYHLGLNTWRSQDGQPPAPEATGLYHFAIRYANRRDLAAAFKRLLEHGASLPGRREQGLVRTSASDFSTAWRWRLSPRRATRTLANRRRTIARVWSRFAQK